MALAGHVSSLALTGDSVLAVAAVAVALWVVIKFGGRR